VLGGIFGRYITELYAELFRFPLLIYRPSSTAFLIAATASVVATLGGALGALQRCFQLRVVDRLGEEVVGAALHRLDGVVDGAVAGNENDRSPCIAAGESRKQLQARMIG